MLSAIRLISIHTISGTFQKFCRRVIIDAKCHQAHFNKLPTPQPPPPTPARAPRARCAGLIG